MTIKMIWFDLGNVLLDFDFTPAFKKISRLSGVKERELREFFHERPWLEAHSDEGVVTADELHSRLHERFGLKEISYVNFRDIWNNIFTPNRQMIHLVSSLKKKGIPLLLLTNTNALHYEYIVNTYSFIRNFDYVVASHLVGTRKPKPAIFEHALKTSPVRNAKHIFYTDDRADFIEAAKDHHGVNAHRFKNAASCKNLLRQGGVL